MVRNDKNMEIGIAGKQEIVVTKELTAEVIGSGLLPVYATPSMIALMENTASKSVEEFLEEGQGTVGTSLNIKHLSATAVGKAVTCESKLIEVDRKRLVFEVKAFDETGLIGEGIHERFIIDNKKFMERTLNK